MSEREGVIQYRLAFTRGQLADVEGIDELIVWRRMLRLLGLIGQDPARYSGLGFGNISLRVHRQGHPLERPSFVISGSQTGHLADLGPQHFAEVTDWNAEGNWVEARGPVRPSSEALTHAAIYAADKGVRCVVHAHSPEIWRSAGGLALATTPAEVTYGTPRMAEEVQRVVRSRPPLRILVMQGHEDGVIAWDVNVLDACITLLTTLAGALRLERRAEKDKARERKDAGDEGTTEAGAPGMSQEVE
jgi:hypothetical protein